MLIIFLGTPRTHIPATTRSPWTTCRRRHRLVFAPWIASYTESVEEKNPALVATGLALWGWILRIVVGLSFIFLPLVITSVNPIVDNLPVAETVIHGQSDFGLRRRAPRRDRFRQRTGAPGPAGQGSAPGGRGGADPTAANIAAAEKAFGAAGSPSWRSTRRS